MGLLDISERASNQNCKSIFWPTPIRNFASILCTINSVGSRVFQLYPYSKHAWFWNALFVILHMPVT